MPPPEDLLRRNAVDFKKAIEELGRVEYVVWTLLCSLTNKELEDSIRTLAKLTKQSRRSVSRSITRLKRMGYIDTVEVDGAHGKRYRVVVLRYLSLTGEMSVINLATARALPLVKPKPEKFHRPRVAHESTHRPRVAHESPAESSGEAGVAWDSSGAHTPPVAHEVPKTSAMYVDVDLTPTSLEKEVRGKDTHTEPRGSMDLGRFREVKATRKKTSAPPLKELGPSHWRDIEAEPGVQFKLDPEVRDTIIDTLNRKRSKARVELLDTYEKEVKRQYIVYRRFFQPKWEFDSRLRSSARQLAEQCLRSGVTFVQVLQYWSDPENNFTRMKRATSSLAFMASPKNFDYMESVVDGAKDAKPKRPKFGHGFSDVSELHPELRESLEAAGFFLGDRTDRELLTVQSAARAIAKGIDISLAEEIRDMAEWAAKYIYSEGV